MKKAKKQILEISLMVQLVPPSYHIVVVAPLPTRKQDMVKMETHIWAKQYVWLEDNSKGEFKSLLFTDSLVDDSHNLQQI